MQALEVEYMNEQYAIMPDLKKYDFTEYMDNVSKPLIPAYKKTFKANSTPYEVAPEMEKILTKAGWMAEPYDAGTLMAYPG